MLTKPDSCRGCPLYEPPYGKPDGFSIPDGQGTYGVLIVAEALGAHEEQAGIPLVGDSGHLFFAELRRLGLEREGFTIANTIACRPPDNKLVGMPYEQAAITHCAPNLDAIIQRAQPKVILTLGKTAFKRILGIDSKHPIFKQDYLCYPIWSDRYQVWVIAAHHPAFLNRGQTHLIPVLQFAAKRAVEIAAHGNPKAESIYLLDPPPPVFQQWIRDLMQTMDHDPTLVLSYDIETPMKRQRSEDDLDMGEEDEETILRCGFSYAPHTGVSVPWTEPYLPLLEQLFGLPVTKLGWNADQYDYPKVSRWFPINGLHLDGMLAWHVLNSALPKGLGFVAPFYVEGVELWKHLANENPSCYNTRDADYALQCWRGIHQDLKDADLWGVFERHIIQVNKVLGYMSHRGLLLDQQARQAAEQHLTKVLEQTDAKIQAIVPLEVRSLKVYRRTPQNTDGFIQTVGVRTTTRCPQCQTLDVRAAHYRSIGKARLRRGEPENPCVGQKSEKVEVPATLWAKPLPFKISTQSLLRYQRAKQHRPIIDPKRRTAVFDVKAIQRLQKRYPQDLLYPQVLELRKAQKLLSTYIGRSQPDGRIIGGMPTREGRVHTIFTQNPSTLRTASQDPNLQNLPRPRGPEDNATLVRNLIIAAPGHLLYARDFSGIEAVLVGYFAGLKDYIRLAKIDVHSFYTAYALYELDRRIPANDLPLLTWDDVKLAAALTRIKTEFKKERNELYKHLVHGANFFQGPKGAAEKIFQETGIEYPTALVKKVMDIYFDLFPGIRTWHHQVLSRAHRDGFLRNPFGYVLRFHRVYEWEKIGEKWQKSPGQEANKAIAFLPQSTAAGIIKEALLRLFFDNFEQAGQYLRLIVHDELLLEVPYSQLEQIDSYVKLEMERPIPQLPLPPEWNMGSHLAVLTESKVGERWGTIQ